MKTKKSLRDLYSFPGFRARATLKHHPEYHEGFIVTLERRQKKRSVQDAVKRYPVLEIDVHTWYGTWMPEQPVSILSSSIAGLPAHIAKP